MLQMFEFFSLWHEIRVVTWINSTILFNIKILKTQWYIIDIVFFACLLLQRFYQGSNSSGTEGSCIRPEVKQAWNDILTPSVNEQLNVMGRLIHTVKWVNFSCLSIWCHGDVYSENKDIACLHLQNLPFPSSSLWCIQGADVKLR